MCGLVRCQGVPNKIISDNVKGFEAASKDISNVTRQYITSRIIIWEFIVEKPPSGKDFFGAAC